MHPDTAALPWLEYVVMGVVIGGFLTFIVVRIVLTRGQGSMTDPLPRLDRTVRAATVVAVHAVPPRTRRRSSLRRREAAANHDVWLIEVEYTDAAGHQHRACLADLIPTRALERFTIGAACRVYGFEAPHTRFQTDAAPAAPAAERCLLAEEHGGVERAGFDLDGVRAKFERQLWSVTRAGSPFLGVMAFVTDTDRWQGEVIGHRTSFPGDPRGVWARAHRGPAPSLERSRDVPRPESVAEVAKWEDPNGFGRTELYHAPIFWVCLPLAALGFLIWGTVTDPGDGWTGNLFDDDTIGNLWNYWLVWVAVAIWLLIAIGVLALRVYVASEVRADNQWIYEHGVPWAIHVSPFMRSGGEGESWPTFIGTDHRVPDEKAARIHAALRSWLSNAEVQWELDSGSLQTRSVITSQELFGADAAGGGYIASVPGFGSADHFAAHEWVLLTEPRDGDGGANEPTVTTVPLEEKRQKIRRKLRTKSARR